MSTEVIRIERPITSSRLFAHTRWDAVPVAAGLFHLAYLFGLYFLFPRAPLWVMLILGLIYSLMVNANINGVGHNFIHNPFFRSKLLNRLFGHSMMACVSRKRDASMQHHKGIQIDRTKTAIPLLVIDLPPRGRRRSRKSVELLFLVSSRRCQRDSKELQKQNGDLFWAIWVGGVYTLLLMASLSRHGDSLHQLAVHTVFRRSGTWATVSVI
jgi:hypothetical protein